MREVEVRSMQEVVNLRQSLAAAQLDAQEQRRQFMNLREQVQRDAKLVRTPQAQQAAGTVLGVLVVRRSGRRRLDFSDIDRWNVLRFRFVQALMFNNFNKILFDVPISKFLKATKPL